MQKNTNQIEQDAQNYGSGNDPNNGHDSEGNNIALNNNSGDQPGKNRSCENAIALNKNSINHYPENKAAGNGFEQDAAESTELNPDQIEIFCQDEELMAELADFFSVFGDMTRVRILGLLRNGPMNVGQIAESLNMTDSAVSHQLRVLKSNDLLRMRRDGRYIYYYISDEHVNTIFDMGLRHLTEG